MKWWYIHIATFFILPCYNIVMIYTYRNFFHPFLFIPQLFIILPCCNEAMIYTYHNSSLSFRLIMKWRSIHSATVFYPSLLWWSDDIYIAQLFLVLLCCNIVMIYTYRNFFHPFLFIPQLFIILPCCNEAMIYTYHNSSLSFRLIMKWRSIHSATVFYPSLLWWSDDIYIAQLFLILLCCNKVMIYTYRNFSSSFLVVMKWWYIHTATFLYPFLS